MSGPRFALRPAPAAPGRNVSDTVIAARWGRPAPKPRLPWPSLQCSRIFIVLRHPESSPHVSRPVEHDSPIDHYRASRGDSSNFVRRTTAPGRHPIRLWLHYRVPLTLLALMLAVSAAGCDRRDAAPSALLPVEMDEAWGFIDASGRVRIAPQFDHAERFSEGIATVQLDTEGYWGAIDVNGSTVIPFEYATLFPFQGRFAKALLPPDSEDAQRGIRWRIQF